MELVRLYHCHRDLPCIYILLLLVVAVRFIVALPGIFSYNSSTPAANAPHTKEPVYIKPKTPEEVKEALRVKQKSERQTTSTPDQKKCFRAFK